MAADVVITKPRNGLRRATEVRASGDQLTVRNTKGTSHFTRGEIARIELGGALGVRSGRFYAQVVFRDGRTWPIDATAERRQAGLVEAPELEAHIRALNGWLAGD